MRGLKLWRRIKSPNPALNVFRRNEPVATDTVYGSVPAVNDGSTAAQFFVGRKSGFCSVEPLGLSDRKFPIALMNHIRQYGAMDQLVSDNAKALISEKVEEILGTFGIKSWNSEPHNKNQNYGERRYRDVRRMVKHLLAYSGAPENCWLLALQYACFVLNHVASERLGWRTPSKWLLGSAPDITVLLYFVFFQPVYYQSFDKDDDEEHLGRFVGIAENVGHSLTFKILTKELQIISRSLVRPATETGVFKNKTAIYEAPGIAPVEPNAKVKVKGKEVEVVIPETVNDDDEDGETNPDNALDGSDPIEMFPEQPVADEGQAQQVVDDDEPENDTMDKPGKGEPLSSAMDAILEKGGELPTFDASDLLGRTYITDPDDNQEQRRVKIYDVDVLEDRTADDQQPLFRFKAKVGAKRFEEIMTYHRMLEWCDRDVHKDDFYRLETIVNHRKNSKSPSGWEVDVQWASGETTWNDLSVIFNDDPVTVSVYAQKNNLLRTPGWRRCKRYVRNAKTLGRAINQVRLKSYRNRPKYKYGHQVPRDHNEALLIDEKTRMGIPSGNKPRLWRGNRFWITIPSNPWARVLPYLLATPRSHATWSTM